MNFERKILICYNEPIRYYNNYLGKEINNEKENIDLSEHNFLNQIDNIKKILSKKYLEVNTLSVNSDIKTFIKKILSYSPDVIINFVESIEGNSNLESYIAGLYDILGIPYTGNNAICLANCLDKVRTKQILKSHRIKTPRYYIAQLKRIPSSTELKLKYPVITKLLREDASIGISEFSVISNYRNLKKQLEYLFENFNQDVLIEEYIEGRELNVAILGDEILPISEICFESLPEHLPKIITYEAKWSPESIYYKHTIPKCPAELEKSLKEKIEAIAKKAFDALECRDYARVDIRLNKNNIPYVIEVNPNPDISPDAGFIRSAAAAGISYEEVLYRITNFALQRQNYDTQVAM
ncbi:D-alanine--D-alanine ligase family protein [Rosettibacter firmus]|uniref:D-alanine--D-alanine ligase family protein n=1 Tax=Rosettibacter firmus TaxID=3111522 RepID=UPI00336BC5A3